MNARHSASPRRQFLCRSTFFAAAMATPGLFAEELTLTAEQTEGPFYPDRLPLDTDNDLLILNDAITPAVGEVTYLSGRVLSRTGTPLRNVNVEIWQTDNHGAYIHSQSSNKNKSDSNFQGFGRFLTDAEGRYFFRTIKPVSYPGRTPHIHFAINRGSSRLLTTQCYIKGHTANQRDGVLNRIRDDAARRSVLVDFEPIRDAATPQFRANFDIVLGMTPADRESDGTTG